VGGAQVITFSYMSRVLPSYKRCFILGFCSLILQDIDNLLVTLVITSLSLFSSKLAFWFFDGRFYLQWKVLARVLVCVGRQMWGYKKRKGWHKEIVNTFCQWLSWAGEVESTYNGIKK